VARDTSQTFQAVGTWLSVSTVGGSTGGTQTMPGAIAEMIGVPCPSATLCVGVGNSPAETGSALQLTVVAARRRAPERQRRQEGTTNNQIRAMSPIRVAKMPT
jgi:hypothetical protein